MLSEHFKIKIPKHSPQTYKVTYFYYLTRYKLVVVLTEPIARTQSSVDRFHVGVYGVKMI